MHANQLTQDVLRSLSEVEADEPVVVSMFVDLDPSRFATPPARRSQFNSLLNALDDQIRDSELSHDAREVLKADRDRIASFFDEGVDPSGAAAIAIYSSQALGFFEAVTLAEPLEASVHVDLRPRLEPVLGQRDESEWCVLLVTRDAARIFRGGPTGLREVQQVDSDVKGQHQKGGWSQARFERSVEREVEWHLEAVTELLFTQFKREPFDHLIVSANNQNLRPALTAETHSYLLERLRGWIDIDEEHASAEEVFAAAHEVMETYLDERENELLERLRASGDRSATTLDSVLEALVAQRVETLILREGAEAGGVKCVTCGWIGMPGRANCPVDETPLDDVENIVEPAIQAAIQQSADIHVLRSADDPDTPGDAPFVRPLAAVLRY